jgi:Carboxypeptidase regulatory-like domain
MGLPVSFAQSPTKPVVRIATVSGFVTDKVGGSLPEATVTFKKRALEKKAIATHEGHYELELPTGKYEVTARFQGCKNFRLENWDAQLESSNTLNISLNCPSTPIE